MPLCFTLIIQVYSNLHQNTTLYSIPHTHLHYYSIYNNIILILHLLHKNAVRFTLLVRSLYIISFQYDHHTYFTLLIFSCLHPLSNKVGRKDKEERKEMERERGRRKKIKRQKGVGERGQEHNGQAAELGFFTLPLPSPTQPPLPLPLSP